MEARVDRGANLRLNPRKTLDGYAISTFTDNFVLGYPIGGTRNDGEIELTMFSLYLCKFQLNMILHGFFLRGGMAIGDLYMDDIVVYGNGLIEAYEAEKNLAQSPRIVLCQSAKNAVSKHLDIMATMTMRHRFGSTSKTLMVNSF